MENNNKSIVSDFYAKVLRYSDTKLADIIIKEDYIQHSPTVKTGKAGLKEFLGFLKQMPKPENPPTPFFRFIADGNFVAVHLWIEFMGQAKAVVDLFRLEGGQLAEHWDASEDIPELDENDHDAVAGPFPNESDEDTELNKSIVSDFVNRVLIGREDSWQDYLSDQLIQHNPGLDDGIDALKAYFQKFEKVGLHKVLGEGDFVISQSEVILDQSSMVLYDIYRLANQLIVEHWSVKQAIPSEMAHDNGMI